MSRIREASGIRHQASGIRAVSVLRHQGSGFRTVSVLRHQVSDLSQGSAFRITAVRTALMPETSDLIPETALMPDA
jgi:hypothetical protein